jgi:GDPmannose 4,6-dehydratase
MRRFLQRVDAAGKMSLRMKRALITGIAGQDASYLSKLLLDKGYRVYGTYRQSASLNLWRHEELGILSRVETIPMDLLETTNIVKIVEKTRPDELYHLAGHSSVARSFEQPIDTMDVDALGTARLLEALRASSPHTRFYQASSSEMFGNARESPHDERTPFSPCSPYAAAKVCAHWLTVQYRQAHKLHATSGILFNHESPLRGIEFVTRKITSTLARIRHGYDGILELGNLDAQRDWGYAQDYVHGMWLMLQQERADDYVLATGISRSVREFVERAADAAGLALAWEGEGVGKCGIDRKSGRRIVGINPKFYRPADIHRISGNSQKAKSVLGWTTRTLFDELVEIMVKTDLDRAAGGPILH